jgi:hypothetical protein
MNSNVRNVYHWKKKQKESEKPKLTNAEPWRLYRERKKAERVNAGASTSSAPLL